MKNMDRLVFSVEGKNEYGFVATLYIFYYGCVKYREFFRKGSPMEAWQTWLKFVLVEKWLKF